MPKADVLFITCATLPDLDPDDRLVIKSLGHLGIVAKAAVWNDPTVEWEKAKLCVLRSTWDYHTQHQAFLDWARAVANVSRLWNPLAMLSWASHKGYLRDLAQAGIAVVPTEYFKNHPEEAKRLLQAAGQESVLKPAVGLASAGVRKVDLTSGADSALAHLQTLPRGCDMMIQPYLSSVMERGEQDLVFINGRYSHTVQKQAFQEMAIAGHAGETKSRPEEDELELAYEVMHFVETKFAKDTHPFPYLYGRVDTARNAEGKPVVMELELIEPSLFLGMHSPAVGAMTVGISERL